MVEFSKEVIIIIHLFFVLFNQRGEIYLAPSLPVAFCLKWIIERPLFKRGRIDHLNRVEVDRYIFANIVVSRGA